MGITSTLGTLKCLAQGHYTEVVGFDGPLAPESEALPLSHRGPSSLWWEVQWGIQVCTGSLIIKVYDFTSLSSFFFRYTCAVSEVCQVFTFITFVIHVQ